MIQLNLPEISELPRIYARPDKPKFHPGTGKYGYKNPTLPNTAGVYFVFNTLDELVYIGVTVNIQGRIAAHLGTNDGVSPIKDKNEISKLSYILKEDVKYSLDGIERIYIDVYKPKYNDIPTLISIYQVFPAELQRWAMKDVVMR